MEKEIKQQIIEKEEELEALRQLVSESQVNTEQKDDRFFKRIVLQQLGVIRMAASNPTTANQELLKRMKEITSQEVNVDALLNWTDLYQTMDYIYDGFYTSLVERFGNILNEKEIQLCCLLKKILLVIAERFEWRVSAYVVFKMLHVHHAAEHTENSRPCAGKTESP